MCKEINIKEITKNDFELLPSKVSIARLYVQYVAALSQLKHNFTHEDIYFQIGETHYSLFNKELPWSSYDSFRKWTATHKKEIY